MNEGIFVAASGGMKQQHKLEVLSNNLANVNTPGFKKNQMAFEELVPPFQKDFPNNLNLNNVSKINSHNNSLSYVGVSGFMTDFSQGTMMNTGNSFDMAIEGDGFFIVETAQGIRYTRAGSFALDNNSQIVNKQGHPFLDNNNKPILLSPDAGQITVGTDGIISINIEGNPVPFGKIKIVDFEDKSKLIKEGAGLYKAMDPSAVEKISLNSKMLQGFIESSNVSVIEEMVTMIQSARIFEAYQKLIQSIDEADNQSINTIGRVA